MNKLCWRPILWQVSSGSESNVTHAMIPCVRRNCLCLEIMMKIAQCVWSFSEMKAERKEKHNLNSSRGSRMVCAKFDSLFWFLLDCHHSRWDVRCTKLHSHSALENQLQVTANLVSGFAAISKYWSTLTDQCAIIKILSNIDRHHLKISKLQNILSDLIRAEPPELVTKGCVTLLRTISLHHGGRPPHREDPNLLCARKAGVIPQVGKYKLGHLLIGYITLNDEMCYKISWRHNWRPG